MTKNNNLGDLGYPTVQDYVVDNYGEKVLEEIYNEITLNEWDYFVSVDSKYELEEYIESFI